MENRFLNFDKDGVLTSSNSGDIKVLSESIWCYDNEQKYFIKGDRNVNLVLDKDTLKVIRKF